MLPSRESTLRNTLQPWKFYAVVIGALAVVLYFAPLQNGAFATIDFLQYWSAWSLMSQGVNPYDPYLLLGAQSGLSSPSSPLIFSWNPPWTFTLLAPFLLLPFSEGAAAWCLFQIGALFFIATTAPKALKTKDLGVIGGTSVVLLFLPSLYAIYYGQLGILFAFSITCFLLALDRKRYLISGVSLLPLTVKPHLFALCLIPGLFWLLQIPRADAVRFLLGCVGGFVLIVGATIAVEPSSLSWWLGAMVGPLDGPPELIHFQQWMTHTTSTAVRLTVREMYGVNPMWPLLTLPATAFLLTGSYFFIRRPLIVWPSLLPFMLCLSLATSSYAWVYDQPVLALCQYLLVAKALSCEEKVCRTSLLIGCAATQLVPFILLSLNCLPGYSFFLMPWSFLVLLLLARHHKGTPPENENSPIES